MPNFALTLRAARVERGLSQAQLAYLAQLTNITISNLENGVTRPQPQTKEKIEEFLGPVDWDRTYAHGQTERQILSN